MTSTKPLDLDAIRLDKGAHNSPADGHCLLEVVSMFQGQPFNDHPKCVSPFLRSYGIGLNDRANDERRQDLKRFIPLLPGTAGDGLEDQRRWLAMNHAARVVTPKWLDRAGLTELAERLRALDPTTDDATYRAARTAIRDVRDATWKIRTERHDVIREAARKAVREHFATKPDAAAIAVADAVAAAVAAAAAAAAAIAVAVAVAAAIAAADAAVADVAAAAAAADPWGDYYTAVRKAVYDRVRAVYEERFADLIEESWQDGLALFDQLIAPELVSA